MTPADLAAAIKAGGTVNVPPGAYGDVVIRNPVHVVFADGAVVNTLTIMGTTTVQVPNVTVENVQASMAFGATTSIISPVVRVLSATNCQIFGGKVQGPIALTGVDPSASAMDATGNVIGYPTGVGITFQNATGLIKGVEVTQTMRGIAVANAKDLTISGVHVHHIRGAMIDGYVISNVEVSDCHLHDAHPWNWGHGDHADFIHLWTQKDSGQQASNIRILRNRMAQGQGVGILGILCEDNSLKGFTGLQIDGNVLFSGHGMGIAVENADAASSITNNVLMQTSGDPFHDCPTIHLQGGSTASLSGNVYHVPYGPFPPNNTSIPAGPNPALAGVI